MAADRPNTVLIVASDLDHQRQYQMSQTGNPKQKNWEKIDKEIQTEIAPIHLLLL